MATIAELSEALSARRISSVELVQDTFARIAKAQPALNAFITVDEGGALAARVPPTHARAAATRCR